jgi:hypothetical protein
MLVVIGLPLILRSRRRGGQNKGEEFCQHLLTIGIDASLVEGESIEEMEHKRSWGERPEAIIKIDDRNINQIDIVGASSQYGTNYYLDYLVRSPKLIEKEPAKKIKLKKKKGSPPEGKIEWNGGNPLARRLNSDYSLEDKLLLTDFKGGIEIIPEPKWGYTRIKTDYFLPSPDLFEAIDIIAGHICSEYG